jgi:hypothetical protein
MKMEPVLLKENNPTVIHTQGYKPSLDFLEFRYFERSPQRDTGSLASHRGYISHTPCCF